jgi:transposase-like protein
VRDNISEEPKTLQEAIIYFADPNNCLNYLVPKRWPRGVACPTCGSKEVRFMASRRIWQCRQIHPQRQFSVKIGTIFEDSPLGLNKWLPAVWMLTSCKNGISSCELARDLKVTQKTAWFMLHRIRLALQGAAGGKLDGEDEVDETFIGGKARNMHLAQRKRRITGSGPKDKVAVMGVVERGGEVRAFVVGDRKKRTLQPEVRKHVEAGSAFYSDDLKSYEGLQAEYAHKVIDHAVAYVDGAVHTNTMENFWSLLSADFMEPTLASNRFISFRYLDEQMFRYNNRKELDDRGRFDLAVSQIVGKRLTYADLSGKNYETCHS